MLSAVLETEVKKSSVWKPAQWRENKEKFIWECIHASSKILRKKM
jgi:hypothetical protein